MAPEKSLKDAGNQKQKVMIAIVVIVVLIVIWQVMGMKSGGGATAPAITATPGGAANNGMKTPGSPSGMSAAGGGAMGQMGAQAAAPMLSTSELSQPRPMPVQTNTEILKLQQQTQADYIASINKLQMLKIQREIDETKTAIATAELNRMTAEKSIADLITSKENMPGNIDMPPQINPTTVSTTTVVAPAPMPVMPQQPQLIPYTVSSVSFEGRKWTAILTNAGKTNTVVVGDVLEDGSIVTGITRNSVTLKRDTKVRTLTISSSI
jgi:hypothetical protein